MKRKTIFLFLCLFFLGWSGTAHALTEVFTTYNGFGPVSQAFHKIALIFSDASYNALFSGIIVFGMVVSSLAFTMKNLTGLREFPLQWILPVFVGIALYSAFFVPKGTIIVDDPVLNRFDTIPDIPIAIVSTVAFTNKIETGLVDIIDTAGGPTYSAYKDGAGGIGFTALKQALATNINNDFLQESLTQYTKDCVMFEVSKAGTTLAMDDLLYKSTDVRTEFQLAASAAIPTIYYSSANPSGTSMSCSNAWTNLNTDLNDATLYSDALANACGKSMFDPNNTQEMARCDQLLTDTLLKNAGLTVTSTDMIRQSALAGIIYSVLSQASPNAIMAIEANRQIVSSGMGMTSALNEWLPILRAILTAIAIGILPFLTLFIPTPLFGKALSVMVGFFVFLATWGVTDAVIHGAAMDYATEAMTEISKSGLSVSTCMSFPILSTKIMAMFGMVRGAGLMLASFLTTILIKFGGHGLSMLAGNLQSAIAGGGAAAAAALTPEGQTRLKSGLVNAASQDGWMNSNSFGEMVRGGVNRMNMDTIANTKAFDAKREGYQNLAGHPVSGSEFMQSAAMGGPSGGANLTTTDGRSMVVKGAGGAGTITTPPNDLGFSTITTAGAHGKWESVEHTQGPGGVQMKTVPGADGIETIVGATLPNVSTNFGQQIQQGIISDASKNLVFGTDWNKVVNYKDGTGVDRTTGDAFRRELSNSTAENLVKGMHHRLEAGDFKNQELRSALEAVLKLPSGLPGNEKAAGAAIPTAESTAAYSTLARYLNPSLSTAAEATAVTAAEGVAAAGLGPAAVLMTLMSGSGYSVGTQGSQGHKASNSLSTDDGRTLQTAFTEAQTHALSDTLQKKDNLEWATAAARQTGANESYGELTKIQNSETNSASYQANLLPGIVQKMADERFNGNIEQAAHYINRHAETPDVTNYLSEYARQHKPVDFQAQDAQQKIEQAIEMRQTTLQHDPAMIKAGQAQQKTTNQDFSLPTPSMTNPNIEGFTKDFSDRETALNQNKNNMSGGGVIGGYQMAKDGFKETILDQKTHNIDGVRILEPSKPKTEVDDGKPTELPPGP